jgi:hypothetical protein
MQRLASGLERGDLGQCDTAELADTAHALAHAGALGPELAQRLLQHTAAAAAAGRLSVQELADVLAALGAARCAKFWLVTRPITSRGILNLGARQSF